MNILLLVSDGFVGLPEALNEAFKTKDCEFYIKYCSWKKRKKKALKKNLLFSARKFFWLEQDKRKVHPVHWTKNAFYYAGEIKHVFDGVKFDALISFGWDKKIPTAIYTRFPIAVNVHPSMLPKYKGWNPVKRAFEDKQNGGVSIHLFTDNFDEGKVLLQKEVSFKDKNLKQCYYDSAKQCGILIREFCELTQRGKIK